MLRMLFVDRIMKRGMTGYMNNFVDVPLKIPTKLDILFSSSFSHSHTFYFTNSSFYVCSICGKKLLLIRRINECVIPHKQEFLHRTNDNDTDDNNHLFLFPQIDLFK